MKRNLFLSIGLLKSLSGSRILGCDKKKFLIVVAAVVAVLIVIIFATPSERHSGPQDIYFTGEYPQVANVSLSKDGKEYDFEAFEGHVMVFFEAGTPYLQSKFIIENNGGKILSQIVDMNYFLVGVESGTEGSYIETIESEPSVDYAFLHTVAYPCAMDVHVIDNFKNPDKYGHIHGKVVVNSMKAVCDDCVVHNCDNSIGTSPHLADRHKAVEYLNDMLNDGTDSPLLINMSFGAGLRGEKLYSELIKGGFWSFKESKIDDWVEDYVSMVAVFVQAIENYKKNNKDKDLSLIITLAAGNDGCHEFDSVVLRALEEELTLEEQEIVDNHIVFVSAYDEVVTRPNEDIVMRKSDCEPDEWETRYDYPNRAHNYHRWVTSVDITDLSYPDGSTIDGTSFSSPTALGYIASVMDEYGITSQEAMEAVKKVTKEDAIKNGGAGMLDIVALDKEAKRIADAKLPSFEGVWIDRLQSTKMVLSQSGSQLMGSYYSVLLGGDMDTPMGQIEGQISGNTAAFSYDLAVTTSQSHNRYLSSVIEDIKHVTTTGKLLSDNKMEFTINGNDCVYLYKQDGDVSTTNDVSTINPNRQGWDGPTLYGDVESVVIMEYYNPQNRLSEMVKGKINKKSVYLFNKRGDVISVTCYHINGQLWDKAVCKYDSKGNMIEKAYYNRFGWLDYKLIYKYDSKGNMIEVAHYDINGYDINGRLRYKFVYKYDSKGNKIEGVLDDYDIINGRLWYKFVYKYDSKGNMIEEAWYLSDGSLNYKDVYKYDSKGNMIEEARYNRDGRLQNKDVYKYDSKGNIIEAARYGGEAMILQGIAEFEITYRK